MPIRFNQRLRLLFGGACVSDMIICKFGTRYNCHGNVINAGGKRIYLLGKNKRLLKAG